MRVNIFPALLGRPSKAGLCPPTVGGRLNIPATYGKQARNWGFDIKQITENKGANWK